MGELSTLLARMAAGLLLQAVCMCCPTPSRHPCSYNPNTEHMPLYKLYSPGRNVRGVWHQSCTHDPSLSCCPDICNVMSVLEAALQTQALTVRFPRQSALC